MKFTLLQLIGAVIIISLLAFLLIKFYPKQKQQSPDIEPQVTIPFMNIKMK